MDEIINSPKFKILIEMAKINRKIIKCFNIRDVIYILEYVKESNGIEIVNDRNFTNKILIIFYQCTDYNLLKDDVKEYFFKYLWSYHFQYSIVNKKIKIYFSTRINRYEQFFKLLEFIYNNDGFPLIKRDYSNMILNDFASLLNEECINELDKDTHDYFIWYLCDSQY